MQKPIFIVVKKYCINNGQQLYSLIYICLIIIYDFESTDDFVMCT